jgi:flagellin
VARSPIRGRLQVQKGLDPFDNSERPLNGAKRAQHQETNMSSILTNNSAMVALQTMKSINKNMGQIQNQISTGLKVGSAKDNAATWAISKVMDSDVKSFGAIRESLALGSSTVNVARNAAETVTNLLVEIKEKIVFAQEENVDRAKIQEDIRQLRGQIASVVGAAQFNGLNLVDGSTTNQVDILSSLDRSANGTVTSGTITVDRQNLSVSTPVASQAFGEVALTAPDDFISAAGATTGTHGDDPLDAAASVAEEGNLEIKIGQVTAGTSYQIVLDDVRVNMVGGGDTLGQRVFEYVASDTDGTADVARNLANQLSAFFGAATDGRYTATVENDVITLNNISGGATDPLQVGLLASGDGTAGASPSSGGLGLLATVDVTTSSGAASALTNIEGMIQQSIDASAAFGSVQKRIEIQQEFVSKLMDSMKSGIGALVDADMEEASARLQALQVQQQLGIQALSIANQQPQNILSLFR